MSLSVVGAIHVSEGSEVNEGDAICELDSADAVGSAPIEPPPAEALTAAKTGHRMQTA